MEAYLNAKYIIISKEETFISNSLRDISTKIKINHSTISKNLKNKNFYLCTSKITKTQYYIILNPSQINDDHTPDMDQTLIS